MSKNRKSSRQKSPRGKIRSLRARKVLPPYIGEDYEDHWGLFSFENKTVLDIGAEYGSTASFFLEKGAKKVVAVEANTTLFTKLASHYCNDPRVIPINLEVRQPSHFEQLITKFRPDVLKVDCEGCEIHLTLARKRTLTKVPEYLVETHDHIGLNVHSKIEKLFASLGYQYATYEVMPTVKVVHAKKTWAVCRIFEDQLVKLKNASSKYKRQVPTRNDPMSALLELYNSREDLQFAYPEVHQGNYSNLLEWACRIRERRIDAHSQLEGFASWYRENSISGFAKLSTERDAIQNRLSKATAERDNLQNRLSKATAEIDDLHDKLLRSISEAEVIKASFGYRAMRFFAMRFDRLFPNGTRRGEIRRILVGYVHVTMNQGPASLIGQAWSKVKRRQNLITTPTSQSVEGGRRRDQVFLMCDRPALSAKTTVKVGPSFVLAGWAVAESGIKQIEATLDGIPLGLASYGLSRPDVGIAHPSVLDPSRSGFSKMINLPDKSEHVLKIIATSMDGSSATVEGPIQVEVRHLITSKPVPARK